MKKKMKKVQKVQMVQMVLRQLQKLLRSNPVETFYFKHPKPPGLGCFFYFYHYILQTSVAHEKIPDCWPRKHRR
jgi:hypothetical protein